MGGIAFAVPLTIVCALSLVALKWFDMGDGLPLALTLLLAVGNGIIGCVDDLTKFHKKQNEGLTAAQNLHCSLQWPALLYHS